MKFSVLGFNQKKVVEETNLNLNDLLILLYIRGAASSSSMEKKYNESDNQLYVWLSHKKVLEDLPILGIQSSRLKQILSNLCESGFLKTIQVCSSNKRGSKSYYATTERVDELLYDIDEGPGGKNSTRSGDEVEKILPGQAGPGVKNSTSDSKLEKTDKELNIDNNKNFNFGHSHSRTKEKKPNLYQQYMHLINSKVDDNEIRILLIEWLNMMLEIYSAENKTLYLNVLKGKLSMLDDFDIKDWKEVIKFNIQKGYRGFYPLPDNKGYSKKSNGYVDDIPEGINGTHEHYEGDHSLSGLYF